MIFLGAGNYNTTTEKQGIPIVINNSTHTSHVQGSTLSYQPSTSPVSQGSRSHEISPMTYRISPNSKKGSEPTIVSYQMSQNSVNRGSDGTNITYQINHKPDTPILQYQINRSPIQVNRDSDGSNIQYQISHSPGPIGYQTSRSPVKIKYESEGSSLPYQTNRNVPAANVSTQVTPIPAQISLIPSQINHNQGDNSGQSYGSGRKLSYPSEVDEQLLHWTKTQQHRGIIVSSENLRKQALAMIQPYCPDFKASTGWLDKFVARHKLDLQSNTRPTFPG